MMFLKELEIFISSLVGYEDLLATKAHNRSIHILKTSTHEPRRGYMFNNVKAT